MNVAIVISYDATTGVSDTTVAHLPIEYSRYTKHHFPNLERQFAPSRWPSACGQVKQGLVFNRGGCLADVPICAECEAAV